MLIPKEKSINVHKNGPYLGLCAKLTAKVSKSRSSL